MIPVPVAAALSLAVAVQLLLQHSNADYRIGPLKHVLALNEGHRFHHLKCAGIGDVNFRGCQMVCVSPVLISERKIYEHGVRRQAAGPRRRAVA